MRKNRIIFSALILVSAVCFAETSPKTPGTSITWTTSDGVNLVGIYQPPAAGHLVWVLLHGLGSNKQEWVVFTSRLAKQGDGFLIYDMRGHGDSTHLANGGTLAYTDFRTAGKGSQWDHMADDLKSAVDTLKKQFKLDPSRIAVGGASLGANVALLYASQHAEVPALILLSPGMEYAGISSEEPFQRYGKRPVFIAASPGDAYAYASVRQLILHRNDPVLKVASGDGAAHGVNMFNDAFMKKLLDWMKTVH